MKYLLLFMMDFSLVGGLYYYLVYLLQLPYVMETYFVIALFSVCLYIFLFLHHNNEIGIAKMNGREVEKMLYLKRKKRMKLVIAFLFPFVFTVMIDFIYLLLFVDNPYVAGFFNSFKQL